MKFKISINVGISAAFFTIILLMTCALCGFILLTLREILRDDLQKQMNGILRAGTLSVDASALPSLTDPEQETSAPYLALQKQLQTVRDSVSDIRFVYTMRKNKDGDVEFVVDAESDPDTKSHISDVYDTPTPTLLKALDGTKPGETFIEREPTPDKWGVWLSGFEVLGDSTGKVVGIIGIDISATTIQTNEGRAISVMLLVAALVSLAVLLLGFFISRRITVPLKAIEADMMRIQRFQIDDTIQIRTVFQEIRLMNHAIGDMKNSLRAFKRYVPADLVAQLLTLHQEARLGGERRDLTVMFSDIEGFTSWSEKLPPEQLIHLMARYFSGMTEIIHRNHGTVDKYIGDAIMAFWGAPEPLEDHALHACRAALECTRFQATLNDEFAAEGIPPLFTRFGINTGEVLVGNVGYDERLNYTVMGDHVNLASRLESLNKLYKTRVLLSEFTQQRLGKEFLSRPIDCVVVKGKTVPIGVFELLSTDDVSAGHRNYAELSAKAFELYLGRDWTKALAAFEHLLKSRPQDGPAQVLADRCRKYSEQDPGPEWLGAIILHEK